MVYLKICKKGMISMASEKKVMKVKKSINKKTKEDIKIYEKYTCYVVGFIAVLLFASVIKNTIFIPAFLITIGLELFCIAYYFLDNKNKRDLVNVLFIVGVGLVIFAIIYTIIETI